MRAKRLSCHRYKWRRFIRNTSVSEKFKGKAEVDFVNALGVSASVPGNHDFDYGQEVFKERMRQGKNWVAANLYEKDTGEKPLPSYVVVKAGSAKIGIAGFTFPLKGIKREIIYLMIRWQPLKN